MIVPFETLPMAEARGVEESVALLKKMREDGLPSFVIRGAGLELDDAITFVRPVMAKADFKFNPPGATRIAIYAGNENGKDYPEKRPADFDFFFNVTDEANLHIDDIAVYAPGHADSTIVHHTRYGLVEVNTFEATERVAYDEMLRRGSLPPDTMELFRAGRVNGELLVPLNYRTEAGPGDVVVLRSAGRIPVAHYFRSLKLPRISASMTALSYELV